jgi:tRNA(Ile)-lysidine synthase
MLRTELLSRCTFPAEGTEVTCAVSGGADSLALLVLAAAAGCEVTAIHVDHGLRAGSASEAGVVAAAAQRFGAAFRSVSVHVEAGPNLEARAREARYAALPHDVLTGHTADDQAETVLLNLCWGAGLDGLAGMRPANHPLLNLRRHETATLCAAERLEPVDDPSNADLAFRRNRVRHEALPLLAEIASRDVVAVVARQAALLRADAELLDSLASAIDPTDARGLSEAPIALARRAVRRWLMSAPASGGHPPDAAAVDRVLAVANGKVRAIEVAGVGRVSRSGGRLSMPSEAPSAGEVRSRRE